MRKAVRAAIEHEHPSCLGVLELLARSDNPEARAAGEALSVWADAGLGRLAFGDGASARIAARVAGDDDQGARAEPAAAAGRRGPTTTRPSGSAWRRCG